MKKKDLQKKSATELNKHIATLRAQLADMQRDKYLSDDKNTAKKRIIRRDIARALTMTNNKQETAQAETKTTKESK